jgi:hypothetical protein
MSPAPANDTIMSKREVTMDDGYRYMVFYTFMSKQKEANASCAERHQQSVSQPDDV